MTSKLEPLLTSIRAFWQQESLFRRALPVLVPIVTLASWLTFGEMGLLICAFLLPLPFLMHSPFAETSADTGN